MTTARKLPFHRVSASPLITTTIAGADLESTVALLDEATVDPYAVLCFVWWAVEVDLALLCRQYRHIRARCPRATVVFLANAPVEVDLLRSVKVPAELCNHNAFVDEERFDVVPAAARRYRAIYNAALSPYKRHALARDVRGLALVTYPLGAPASYVAEVHATMKSATWINFSPPDRFTWLGEREIARHVASSCVGLCLSSEEGAMYASIEYLLCGVPIVTTPSLGGRHVFFDEENAFVVAPEAHAVATGVDEMVRRTLAPVAIRDRALDAMRQHRERFDALVEEIATRLGGSVPRMGRLRGQFVNRMFRWETPEQVRKLARGAVS